ncbi:MAG: glycosyltransferase family 4 protein, partial [Candidatus Portnoybacteria bacterium]|nr:glycosyltransferase family 4 protein [Candidatus Portnoybacteria bacterium]
DKQIDCQLVLVGELDYFYQRLRKMSSVVPSGRIIFTDFVSDLDLNILYQNASLYVFPSLGEGFGLPPLEAMAFGLPVVCSKATCLPEVLGQAALYFDPENTEEMAEKIKQVLKDKKLQEKLIDQGFKRIQKYQWSKMAQETAEIYLKAVPEM